MWILSLKIWSSNTNKKKKLDEKSYFVAYIIWTYLRIPLRKRQLFKVRMRLRYIRKSDTNWRARLQLRAHILSGSHLGYLISLRGRLYKFLSAIPIFDKNKILICLSLSSFLSVEVPDANWYSYSRNRDVLLFLLLFC